MGIQHHNAADALHALKASAEGLTAAEAARRLAEFGPNHVAPLRREAWVLRLARHFTHFFALILWLAAALAFFAEQAEPGEGMAVLGYAIIGVIIINGLFSFAQEYRAEHALAALQELLPHEVQVLRDGGVTVVAAVRLVPGDIVLLEGGADIPADCRLIAAFGVRVNAATVTGESLPKARHADAVGEDNLLQARNVLLAGTTLVAGEAKAVVFATGARTEFGKIAHLTQATEKVASPLQLEITRLSRWVALLAAGLGVLFFLLGQSLGLSFWANFIFAIGIIVANVPEGLLPTVTLALAMGGQRMARRNALIRHLPSVETLGATTVICTDKTGTLTLNQLRVRKLLVDGAIVDADTDAQSSAARTQLYEAAANCHTLKQMDVSGVRQWLGDPLEAALATYAHARSPGVTRNEKIDELPFDSDRRRMSTLHRTPDGDVLYTKGALEAVLPLCRDVLIDGRIEPRGESHVRALRAAEEALALDGLRVIALARRGVVAGTATDTLESELTLLGLAALEDPARPEVPRAIQQCHDAGIRIIMITGDHPRTALAIARQVGLVRGADVRIIDGAQLARMTETELHIALNHADVVFARIAADQKRRIVATLKRKNEIVAVTGDGVNDAPALREAHIGIAMGIAGTDVAKESADMVLLDDNFASIVAAIEEGRAVFDNIRKFLTYILTSNIPEVVPYLAFVLFKIPLPLTIIQILAVDLGTDMVPALALGAEAPDHDVMKRPPRRRGQRLVDTSLILRSYLWLGLFEAAAAMAAFFFVLYAAGWSYGVTLATRDPLYLQATTACFAAIVVMQIANVWICRSDHASIAHFKPFGNPLILLGIGAEFAVVALIAYTPWGNMLFGTAPLALDVWLFVLPFALVMVTAEEVRKYAVRRKARLRP